MYSSSKKTNIENCIWAPLPSKKYIRKLRENMTSYVKQKQKKKDTVITWIVNEDITHILINLNLETYCLPDIYVKGGKWGLPKGKVESFDKDLKFAAIREVVEETGYHLEYKHLSYQRFYRVWTRNNGSRLDSYNRHRFRNTY